MKKSIFAIGAIALFALMALIPLATAMPARIHGLWNSTGTLYDTENLTWNSYKKIGNLYIYKDLDMVGKARYADIARTPSLWIGIFGMRTYVRAEIQAKYFINFGFPLERAEDNSLDIYGIGSDVKCIYLQ